MKFIILSCFLAFCNILYCHGQVIINKKLNKVDSITNITDVKNLLIDINNDYNSFNLGLDFKDDNCQKVSDSLKIKVYTKADLDNNGLTDLLIVGKWQESSIIYILDSGNNKFAIKNLRSNLYGDCRFPKIKYSNKKTFIDYYYFSALKINKKETTSTLVAKQLIYKFEDFIEFNNKIVDYNIQKIEYKNTPCLGECPVFELEINADKTTKFKDISFNTRAKIIEGKIDTKVYANIINLLNYINFPQLNNNYNVNWTDSQACTLKITYKNGKIKTINDYGQSGTFGLMSLYKYFYEYYKSQK